MTYLFHHGNGLLHLTIMTVVLLEGAATSVPAQNDTNTAQQAPLTSNDLSKGCCEDCVRCSGSNSSALPPALCEGVQGCDHGGNESPACCQPALGIKMEVKNDTEEMVSPPNPNKEHVYSLESLLKVFRDFEEKRRKFRNDRLNKGKRHRKVRRPYRVTPVEKFRGRNYTEMIGLKALTNNRTIMRRKEQSQSDKVSDKNKTNKRRNYRGTQFPFRRRRRPRPQAILIQYLHEMTSFMSPQDPNFMAPHPIFNMPSRNHTRPDQDPAFFYNFWNRIRPERDPDRFNNSRNRTRIRKKPRPAMPSFGNFPNLPGFPPINASKVHRTGLDSASLNTTVQQYTTEPDCCADCVRCGSSSLCIEHTQLCDGVKDCSTGEDESANFCQLLNKGSCPPGLAQCDTSCLPLGKACRTLCGVNPDFEVCYAINRNQLEMPFVSNDTQLPLPGISSPEYNEAVSLLENSTATPQAEDLDTLITTQAQGVETATARTESAVADTDTAGSNSTSGSPGPAEAVPAQPAQTQPELVTGIPTVDGHDDLPLANTSSSNSNSGNSTTTTISNSTSISSDVSGNNTSTSVISSSNNRTSGNSTSTSSDIISNNSTNSNNTSINSTSTGKISSRNNKNNSTSTSNSTSSNSNSSLPDCLPLHTAVGDLCVAVLPFDATWPAARSLCHGLSGSLLELASSQQLEALAAHLMLHEFATSFWIGGYYDEEMESWRWDSGRPMVMSTPYWALKYSEDCLPRSSPRFGPLPGCYHYQQAPINSTGDYCASLDYQFLYHIADDLCLQNKKVLCLQHKQATAAGQTGTLSLAPHNRR